MFSENTNSAHTVRGRSGAGRSAFSSKRAFWPSPPRPRGPPTPGARARLTSGVGQGSRWGAALPPPMRPNILPSISRMRKPR